MFIRVRVFLNLSIVEHTGHGVPLIVEKYGREVFNIQLSYINVSIPFNEKVMALVPQFGTTSGTSVNVNELDPSLTDTQQAVLLELVRRPKATYDGLAEIDGRDGHFDVERRVKRLEVLDFTGYRPIPLTHHS